jgi:lysozyme
MLNKEDLRDLPLLDIIKEDLIRHEGYIREIYLCSENYETFGVGHLVTPNDMEHGWPVGTPVTDERILQCFHDDTMQAVEDAESLVDNLYDHPDNVIRVLVNMAFNLGRTRLGKFRKMIAAVNNHDYSAAADEMEDSRWYHQVGRRSKELVNTMRFEV